MKVLFVETGNRGHNLTYLSNLVFGQEEDSVLVLSTPIPNLSCRQYILKNVEGKKRTLSQYLAWLREVHEYAEKENPDIIHFLSGDTFYRFFGYGLSMFRRYKMVITLHWIRLGSLEKLSIRSICRHAQKVVVHSAYLKRQLNSYGVNNAVHIEYPQFNSIETTKEIASNYWGLNSKIKTLAAIGSTRYDKGIDILMQALKAVKTPYQLLVAGQVNAFTEDQLLEMTKEISDHIFLNIHYLSDEELAYAFAAGDIIVLPYRKTFNGASGPLGEGVYYNKCILGADHGNLGFTIREHHLGYTFESENVEELSQAIELALNDDFIRDETYRRYRESLNPDIFRKAYKNLYESLVEGR